jgi:2,3-bisphosphoglycerate-independent phosphoglycerate mutase
MKTLNKLSNKTLLVILDGFGINENTNKNAIRDAQTPYLDDIFTKYPMTTITAGGVEVGLPKGVPGNSEVGHMNLGAGRPIRQDLVRINESIDNNDFQSLPLLKELKDTALKNSGRIHLMGLLSDGGVHSHIDHIIQVIKSLQSDGIEVFFHAFMDGRDTAKNVGASYIKKLEETKGFTFASMQGRSIGMDRDRRWEKIKTCYDTFIGKKEITNLTPLEYLANEYKNERFDEFVNPVLFNKNYAMKEGDSVFMLNFRPDRAIQITLAMCDEKFDHFKRSFIPAYFLCMTPYVPDEVELPILFNKEKVTGGLTEHLSGLGMGQYKIAETEKYAHITFFFNGGEKKPFPLEKHILVSSPKDVETYDQKPEMSAPEVTDKLLTALESDDFRFYLVNYANSDMVGHTGNYEAAVKAIEYLDNCIEKLRVKCEKNNITMIITADHGNSDQMVYADGSAHTSHTGAPVPFCVVHPLLNGEDLKPNQAPSSLKDVASTICYILGVEKAKTFTGHNIFS